MDTSVTAALITSGVALVVAAGGAARSELQSRSERRYERRHAFLVQAQDTALALRNALREYGSALRARTGSVISTGGAFIMSVPEPLGTAVSVAQGEFDVARSRLPDDAVTAALARWHALARVSLIDPSEVPAADEQRAFDAVNELIGAALRSARGAAPRSPSGRNG